MAYWKAPSYYDAPARKALFDLPTTNLLNFQTWSLNTGSGAKKAFKASDLCASNRVIHLFNGTFGQELAVLHTTCSTFGKFIGTCLELVSDRKYSILVH